jgi:hypothetical protein
MQLPGPFPEEVDFPVWTLKDLRDLRELDVPCYHAIRRKPICEYHRLGRVILYCPDCG